MISYSKIAHSAIYAYTKLYNFEYSISFSFYRISFLYTLVFQIPKFQVHTFGFLIFQSSILFNSLWFSFQSQIFKSLSIHFVFFLLIQFRSLNSIDPFIPIWSLFVDHNLCWSMGFFPYFLYNVDSLNDFIKTSLFNFDSNMSPESVLSNFNPDFI